MNTKERKVPAFLPEVYSRVGGISQACKSVNKGKQEEFTKERYTGWKSARI